MLVIIIRLTKIISGKTIKKGVDKHDYKCYIKDNKVITPGQGLHKNITDKEKKNGNN